MVDKFRELDAAEHAMQDQDLVHAPLPAEPNVSPAEQSPAEPNVSSAEQSPAERASPAEPNVSPAEQSPAERASPAEPNVSPAEQSPAEPNESSAEQSTEEQSTVVHTINQNIEEINAINEVTTGTAEELAQASADLKALSKRLDSLVGGFKL